MEFEKSEWEFNIELDSWIMTIRQRRPIAVSFSVSRKELRTKSAEDLTKTKLEQGILSLTSLLKEEYARIENLGIQDLKDK